jgi:hypothetical protein
MDFALPLYAVQRLANGTWLVRTQMGDPILPAVDVVDVLVGNLKGVGRFIDTYTKVSFAKLYDRKTPITAVDRVLPFFEEEAALVTNAFKYAFPDHTAQMEINVCSDMAQTCWVAIPRLYSNGHRRERPTTY